MRYEQGEVVVYTNRHGGRVFLRKDFMEKSEKLKLNDIIDVNIPVDILHGVQDTHVPLPKSLQLMNRLTSKNVVMGCTKEGDHGFMDSISAFTLKNSVSRMLDVATSKN